MIARIFKLILFKRTWRKLNNHNGTIAANNFPEKLVTVGKMSYGPLEVHAWNADNERLLIGNYVSIASGVKFLLGGNHHHDTFSTYPLKSKFLGATKEAFSKGAIVVEDDVWIGTDVLIMSGLTIGKGAVVAAGSVVTKDVPSYAIVGGNPARVIKYRFDDSMMTKLMDFDFSTIDQDFVEKNQSNLYKKLDENILSELIKEPN